MLHARDSARYCAGCGRWDKRRAADVDVCRQVTEEVNDILSMRGYRLSCRGTVDVKGKGNMITFFLEGVGECEAPAVQDIYNVHNFAYYLPLKLLYAFCIPFCRYWKYIPS